MPTALKTTPASERPLDLAPLEPPEDRGAATLNIAPATIASARPSSPKSTTSSDVDRLVGPRSGRRR